MLSVVGVWALVAQSTSGTELEFAPGYLPQGADLETSEMSLTSAKSWCMDNSKCQGFTYDDSQKLDKPLIFFKGGELERKTGGGAESGWRSYVKGGLNDKPPWPNQHPGSDLTSTGCPQHWEDLSEVDRQSIYKNIHSTWPPSYVYPGKFPIKATKKWNEYHYHKERRLMAIEDPSWRWERWLEQVQIRNLRNWTDTGWALDDMTKKTHKKLLKYYQKNHENAFDEGKVAGYIAGKRSMLNIPQKLKQEVTWETQKLVAKWAGYEPDEIEATSTYGIRTYYDGSILETHVDRVESHILSAVYCVDRKHNKVRIQHIFSISSAHLKTDCSSPPPSPSLPSPTLTAPSLTLTARSPGLWRPTLIC
jgi:hypothetical protein